MDIDRFIARNDPTWTRLEALTKQARLRVTNLGPGELEELVQLYQRASSHLSYTRTHYRDPALTAKLTRIVAASSGVIYGKRARSIRVVRDFFAYQFPAAVYRQRKAVFVSAALFFLPALLMYLWLVNDPQALNATATKAERVNYTQNLFAQYYSDDPHPQFFTQVTTNNIRVSFLVFAAGVAAPIVGPAFLLVSNGAPVGMIGAWMVTEDSGWRFLGYILPHGMLELSAIVIAGGGGLAVGWALIAPGDRRRTEALREEGRRLFVIFLGLVFMLVCAGLIEGFITGSSLPVAVRVAIGILGWVTFVTYLVTQGRAATARGITGTLGELDKGWADLPVEELPATAVVGNSAG